MSFDFLKDAGLTELTFWGFAIFGTTFFLLRVVSMIIGFGAEHADVGDVGHDVGHDVPHGSEALGTDHHSHDLAATDTAFKLVSINSITGFFMVFGWAGLAAFKDHELSEAMSLLVASIAGVLMMYLTAR